MASYQMLWSKAVELEAIRRVPEIEFLIENVAQIQKSNFARLTFFPTIRLLYIRENAGSKTADVEVQGLDMEFL